MSFDTTGNCLNQFGFATSFDILLLIQTFLYFRQSYTNPSTGKYYKEGEVIKRPKFAETLRKIGQSGSSDIFYKGEMGKTVVKELAERGGIITEEDLEKYE